MPKPPPIIVGGGQSGLAAARALRNSGLAPVILESGDRAIGSWPHYYDSLALFSPARYSALPGRAFPADPEHYPTRDEVAAYLEDYAAGLDVDIRTRTRVVSVQAHGADFLVRTEEGAELPASGIVAASGSFTNPHRPELPGAHDFTGQILHSADYRSPAPHTGERVVIVGAGNSAVQIGHELAATATVTLATRTPLRFLRQRRYGRDVHHWLVHTGFDRLPASWVARLIPGPLVLDTGPYQEALASGLMDRRPMFTRLEGDRVHWSDGSDEHVDTVILATGYRPGLDYLRPLGALDPNGLPRHTEGLSITHPGLAYLGLEFQRSFSSNTLRGVAHDADHIAVPLASHIGDSSVVTSFF